MTRRDQLLVSISSTIADYRQNEIPSITPEHVERWVNQFNPPIQGPILEEINHVLGNTYCNRQDVERFLQGLALNANLTDGNPAQFWKHCGILNIQSAGSSQKQMLQIFDTILQANFGYSVQQCTPSSGNFVYIDDGVFSGLRVRQDIIQWVENDAPANATLHVIVIALHLGGEWYANQGISKAAVDCNKSLDVHWWRLVSVEDRKAYIVDSDVLRPRVIPNDEISTPYVEMLTNVGYPPTARPGNSIGKAKLFSSPEGRDLLEREFLHAGLHIRQICPNLPEVCRPLGFHGLRTLGFGSLIVTYRNCPNACPLAFWVGDPWYPLFPRRTNTETVLSGFSSPWSQRI
ncbi:MAG: hypothetical protein KJ626_08915 [Verrucomicrobia bacterium]|nr:hypothetical protein [Verrucomicrobiota bacterium]